MDVFFFWFLFIWMFIGVFADIFRREDLSGWGKAGWIFLIVILPFLGILIYMIARPRMTPQDARVLGEAQEYQRRFSGYSGAHENEKLAQPPEERKLTAEEVASPQQRALGRRAGTRTSARAARGGGSPRPPPPRGPAR